MSALWRERGRAEEEREGDAPTNLSASKHFLRIVRHTTPDGISSKLPLTRVPCSRRTTPSKFSDGRNRSQEGRDLSPVLVFLSPDGAAGTLNRLGQRREGGRDVLDGIRFEEGKEGDASVSLEGGMKTDDEL